MPRTLFVHVGPRKTATSAIQRLLAAHDNSIVIYPKTGLGGIGNYHGHHALVYKFFGEERAGKAIEGSIEGMLQSIAAEVGDSDRNVVISAEVFESKDVGRFVQALHAHLGGSSATNVEILFSCREHFGRAASLYNHRLRTKRSPEKRNPDRFLIETGIEVCYAPFARELRGTGFSVRALSYHPSETWVKRFLLHVGFAEHQIPEIQNELVADSPKVMIANLAVKQIVRTREAQHQYMRPFRTMPGSRSPSKFIFGREAAAFAETHFSVDRKFLLDEFGVNLMPPDLNAADSALFIDTEDLADIAAVAENLGEEGRAIIDFARQYVR